jgi:uncharacterized Zn finger protein
MKRRRRFNQNNYYRRPPPTIPLETTEGIKARSQKGAFAKNWWATRWIEALERLVDPGRLNRGRTYARKGQVLSVEEGPGGILAKVQGSRPQPYKVTINVAPLSEAQWNKVVDALAEQAIFTAQLLAGEMPKDIDLAFKAAGVSLFPSKKGDLTTHCSCPDWANPCKHVAAVDYILGERFDEDPFLLFRLRGRSQEQILQALRQRRSDQPSFEDEEEPEVVLPLEKTLEHFWEPAESLEQFSVAIRLPQIDMPLLKRLGQPSFAGEQDLQSLLRPAYREISQAALRDAE